MQIAAAATQFNAYPYREADKKLGLKISPHIDHSLPASKTLSLQKTATVINIQIKVSSADSQKKQMYGFNYMQLTEHSTDYYPALTALIYNP